MSDEYIDYSCSTSLERLSRDVETILRSWFVIDGSDRHVGFRDSHSKTANVQMSNPWATKKFAPSSSSRRKRNNQYTPVKEYNKSRLLSPPRSAMRCRPKDNEYHDGIDNRNQDKILSQSLLSDSLSSSFLFHTPPRTRKDLYVLEDARKIPGVQLIRSGKISYITNAPNTNSISNRVEIELDLCLWDGPPASEVDIHQSNHQKQQMMPMSLMTNSNDPFPKTNIISDLSSIFGIGQHLTLSPASPEVVDSFLQLTVQAMECVNHPGKKKKMSGGLMAAMSSRQTLEGTVSLHTAALRVLSNQLQTAMNIAVVSCDCRIPVFGIWGIYQPDTVKRSIDGKIEDTLMQSVMEVPSWMSGGDFFNIAAEGSVCCLFRKHIENLRKGTANSKDAEGGETCTDSVDSFSGSIDYDDDGDDYDDENDENGDDAASFSSRQMPQDQRRKDGIIWTPSRTSNVDMPPTPLRKSQVENKNVDEQYLPAIMTGLCYAGGSFLASGANFEMYVVPPGIAYPVHCTTLNSLGQLLLQHSPTLQQRSASLLPHFVNKNEVKGIVSVSGARHKYTWSKLFQIDEDYIPNQENLLLAPTYVTKYKNSWKELNIMTYGLSWRQSANTQLIGGDGLMSTEQYKNDCQARALKMLFRASCCAKTKRTRKSLVANKGLEPLWGPCEDPVSIVSVSSTWAGSQENVAKDESGNEREKDPILTLPLRIRSHKKMSSSDVIEMENEILSTIFNPLLTPDFQVSVTFDSNAACTTLSATNRCLLASLIRSSALDQSYLLGHICKSTILEELHQNDELEFLVEEIMNEANVSPVTRRLVQALDWASMADMMEEDSSIHKGRMKDIVEQVFSMCSSEEGQYPAPPELFDDSNCHESEAEQVFQPFLDKACRPGRLLSLLFVSMSSLQTPSMMAALWMEFVSELRILWEKRESIPNLGTIPGLDGEELYDDTESNIITAFKTSMQNKEKNLTGGVGSKARDAAFIFSTENDPDLNDCIINQKLQVFNIGVELMNSYETNKLKKKKQTASVSANRADLESVDIVSEDGGNAFPQCIEFSASFDAKNNNSFETKFQTTIPEDDFFDAMGTIYDEESSKIDSFILNNSTDVSMEYEMAYNLGIRLGARCPISDPIFAHQSAQLFAPYVNRDTPLTDDLIVERSNMIFRSDSIESRIDAAHRFQRPKLLSDMSSYKAANPGCGFQDFITWYGNPGNPLNQYDETSAFCCIQQKYLTVSNKTPMDEATEALFILDATRSFWTQCWEDAKPIPAKDQSSLFDAFGAVEMLLLWFETMHPAILINQIVAVNIAMANFILQASHSLSSLRPIREALVRLDEKSKEALRLLSKDIINSFSDPITSNDNLRNPFIYTSPETIKLCESVCTLIGDVEILQARATSLLSKLNFDEKLVSTILEAPEGRNFAVNSSQSRAGILKEIHTQQKRNNGKVTDTVHFLPAPSVREYIIRRNDERSPCQLTVCIGGTFGLEDGGTNSTKGGLVLALKKGSRE